MDAARHYRILAWLAVLHAAAVLALWLAATFADVMPVSGRMWTATVWLWGLWLPLLALHPGRSRRRFIVPTGVSLLLLAPSLPTAYAFTAWSLGGFAP